MAASVLPPVPWDKPQQSYEWVNWYTQLRNVIDNAALNHNSLQNLQGGLSNERNHLSDAEVTKVTNAEQTTNKNNADGYAGLNSVSRTTKGVDTTDDLIVDNASKGLVLKNGSTYYRVTVNGSGVLVVTSLGTTKP